MISSVSVQVSWQCWGRVVAEQPKSLMRCWSLAVTVGQDSLSLFLCRKSCLVLPVQVCTLGNAVHRQSFAIIKLTIIGLHVLRNKSLAGLLTSNRRRSLCPLLVPLCPFLVLWKSDLSFS